MILEPQDEWSTEETALEAMWETLKRGLEQAGKNKALLYLRYMVHAELEASEPEGDYRRLRFGLYQRVSDYTASYNAVTGEELSWLFDLLRQSSGQPLDEEACLRAATVAADPPDGAVVETAGFQEHGGQTVYVARWVHEHDGAPVEGDFIQVLVNPATGAPFARHCKWHEVDREAAVR